MNTSESRSRTIGFKSRFARFRFCERFYFSRVWRIRSSWLHIAFLLALATTYWITQGLYGVSPTDDGYVASQSWRLLQGQIPHVDFTSPRPAGSAFLHLPEMLLPFGTLAGSHLVTAFEFLWVSFVSIDIFRRHVSVTPWTNTALVATAFILNVGTWPLMAWHTVDGLFIGFSALWLATRRPTALFFFAAWFVAGLAPLMKQGFLLVPIALALVILSQRRWKAFFYIPAVLIFPAAYLLLVRNTPGGIQNQIYKGSTSELFAPLAGLGDFLMSAGGVAAVTIGFIAAFLARGRYSSKTSVASLAIALVSTSMLAAANSEQLSMGGHWIFFFLTLNITVVVLLVREIPFLLVWAATITLAYGASMSWGAPSPNLMAGSLFVSTVLTVIYGLSRGMHRPRLEILGQKFLVSAVLIIAIAISLMARSDFTYADRVKAELHFSSDIPMLAGMKLSETTEKYISDLQSCLKEHPAEKVTTFPDGGLLYPALGLVNPFAIDWWLPQEESKDHMARVEKVVSGLNKSDNWIVLFQSYNLFQLPWKTLENVSSAGERYAYNPLDLVPLSKLTGTPVSCGSLEGIYRAPGYRK